VLNVSVEGISRQELARRAGASEARIDRLVDIGALEPDANGRFSPADAQRVQIVDAYEAGGIALDEIALALRERRITFEYSDRIYPPPALPSGRTVGDLAASLGLSDQALADTFMALGLPRPDPARALTEDDESVLTAFFAAWRSGGMSPDAPIRAARLIGNTTRRAAEGWVDLFVEALAIGPEQRVTMSVDELGPRMFEPAVRVSELFEPMSVWLLRKHLEGALNGLNVESMERALEAHGLRSRGDATPPAVVFADLTGFTRLTEEEGDQLAAQHASMLADLAASIAPNHDGRLVKQLGDGVMLVFDGGDRAIEAAVTLRRAAAQSALPALHIGVCAGPMIERDGDYFGRTVNLAARLAALAGPGEILADAIAASSTGSARSFELEPVTLKGISGPVTPYRVDAV
jgi:class 3 adenylate cyclase